MMNICSNYNGINKKLLGRYKKYLQQKQQYLKIKAIGSYWTHEKWTRQDQNEWERITKKVKVISKKIG